MSYAPHQAANRRDRRAARQGLAQVADQQIEDAQGVAEDVENEEFYRLFYQDDLLFYYGIEEFDRAIRTEKRHEALSGRFEDGRPITSVSLYIAYVDEAIEDLGPLTDDERRQFDKVVASIKADNESHQVLARV